LWLAFFVAAAGMGWVFPAVSALNANAVRAEEQGAAAGTLVAVHGFGLISGPLLGALLHQLDSRAPYALVGLLLALAAFWPSQPTRPVETRSEAP
ncbi:MFS transporter, partial [Pseudomonas aeruginosa]|nr:MFS transporter [Pseudomonas aeruginosa]HBO0473990.1 MFS transporter [Pseudomonas aeruginosa]